MKTTNSGTVQVLEGAGADSVRLSQTATLDFGEHLDIKRDEQRRELLRTDFSAINDLGATVGNIEILPLTPGEMIARYYPRLATAIQGASDELNGEELSKLTDLIRRARESCQAGKLGEAVKCLTEAELILEEKSMTESIDDLKEAPTAPENVLEQVVEICTAPPEQVQVFVDEVLTSPKQRAAFKILAHNKGLVGGMTEEEYEVWNGLRPAQRRATLEWLQGYHDEALEVILN